MNNISKHLFSIKMLLEKHSQSIAPLIVTDNSWTLIGAAMKIFNNVEPGKYLIWAYQLLVEFHNQPFELSLSGMMKTRLIFCSTHYLKNLIKETKSIKTEKSNKTTLIFCFSLLQDSISIQQIKTYLKNIFLVFNSKYHSDLVENSIKVKRKNSITKPSEKN